MTTIVLPTPTTAEQAQEDFFFIPQLALATPTCVQMTRWRLATPSGPGVFTATFDIDEVCVLGGCLVRYSEYTPPRVLRLYRDIQVFPADVVVMTARIG